MMTSFCFSKRAPALACSLWLAGACLLGCSSEQERNPCVDPPLELGSDDDRPEVLRVASLRLEERTTLARVEAGPDAAPEKQVIVTLAFSDRSLYVPSSRQSAPWSQSCFVLSGKSVKECRGQAGGSCGETTCEQDQTCVEGTCVNCAAQPLSIQGAHLKGLSSPGVDLQPIGDDGSRWRRADLSAPLFGSEPVRLEVTGGTSTDTFPSYTQTVRAPDPIKLVQPTPGSGLVLAGTDLVIEWEKGNGDRIEIALQLDDTNGGASDNAVVCVVEDDGCATVPSLALSLLAPTPQKPLELSVSRVTLTAEEVPDPVETEARSIAIDRVDLQLGQ